VLWFEELIIKIRKSSHHTSRSYFNKDYKQVNNQIKHFTYNGLTRHLLIKDKIADPEETMRENIPNNEKENRYTYT